MEHRDVPDKLNILLVDDSDRKLLTYELILADLGENLIAARSADEALTVVLKEHIALLILDVNMPEIDGFQLAGMIREHPRFCNIPIIFVSAVHTTAMDRMKGYEHGAVDYITAPIDPELLRIRVKVFLRLHRSTSQLEKTNTELSRLSKRLLESQDNERRRIARELHDSVGQELTAAKMVLDMASQSDDLLELKNNIAEAQSAVDQAIRQVRSISYLLHPPMLDEMGLASALKWYIEGLEKRSAIQTSIQIDPANFPRVSPEVETAIFRIVQECLTNVIRHSGGTKACVSLALRNGRLVASVCDDGKGLPESAIEFRPGRIGVGISGMMQRAKELGGELRFQNVNPGTIVEVTIPVDVKVATSNQPLTSVPQQKTPIESAARAT
jgi:signal transduction histidine kinase